MAQIVQPVSDVTTGGWTPTPVYAEIDETPAEDSSKVTSSDDPCDDAFKVRFPALLPAGAGEHKATYRLRRVGSDVWAWIKLLEGDQAIAAKAVQPTTSFADYVLELESYEAEMINNYSNLRAEVSAFATASPGGSEGFNAAGTGNTGVYTIDPNPPNDHDQHTSSNYGFTQPADLDEIIGLVLQIEMSASSDTSPSQVQGLAINLHGTSVGTKNYIIPIISAKDTIYTFGSAGDTWNNSGTSPVLTGADVKSSNFGAEIDMHYIPPEPDSEPVTVTINSIKIKIWYQPSCV